MKAFSLLAVSLVAAAVFFSGTFAYAAGAAEPKVEVTPPNFDFGTISDDAKANASFTIKNVGNAELVIYDVKPTCGCTVADLTSHKIAPGETARLDAVYNPHGASGQIRRFINIKTNAKAETVTLSLSANVIPKPAPDINLSAYSIVNMQMHKGGREQRTIKVVNSGQLDLTINDVSTSPGVSASLADHEVPAGQTVKTSIMLKPGETADLNLVIAPKAERGNFQEVVTIRSNGKKPVVNLIIQGLVQG